MSTPNDPARARTPLLATNCPDVKHCAAIQRLERENARLRLTLDRMANHTRAPKSQKKRNPVWWQETAASVRLSPAGREALRKKLAQYESADG